MNQQKSKGPKSIPTQIQLFGGAVLKGMPFKIVEFHPDGTPKLFELQAGRQLRHQEGIDARRNLRAVRKRGAAPHPVA